MAQGISLAIASDTRAFERGIRAGVVDPLDDMADVLKDVEKAGDNAGDELVDSMRDAQRQTEKLEDEHERLAKTIRTNASQASQASRQSYEEQAAGFKESAAEIKQEAVQNLSETVSSFDGSAQSFVDGIQGTFGGVVSALGPLGMVAGAAGAIGIGLISSALEDAEEKNAAFREQVQSLAQDLIDTGDDGEISIGYIVDQLKEMATTTDDQAISLDKVRQRAKDLNVPFKDLAASYAGGTDAIQDQIDKIDLLKETYADLQSQGIDITPAGEDIDAQLIKLEATRESLVSISGAAAEAKQQEQDWLDAGGPELEAKQALISAVDTAYDDAAGSVDDYVSAETGLFDVTAYIDAMNARAQALADYQTSLAESALSTEAKSFLNEQGVDAAAAMMAGYKAATTAEQAELARIWKEAGQTSSGSYTDALQSGLPTTVTGPTIKVGIDTSVYDDRLNQTLKKEITQDVRLRLLSDNGRQVR